MSENNKEPAAEVPVENGAAVEEIQKEVPSQLGAQLYLLCAVAVLILTVVGTPTTWIYKRDPKAGLTTYVSLWRQTANGQNGSSVFLNVNDIQCKDIKDRFKAAEAFAIISIAVSIAAIVVGFMNFVAQNQLKCLVFFVNLFLFTTTLITWGIGMNVYMASFCSQRSFYNSNFQLYAGAGLFIAAWILTIFAPILMIANPSIPDRVKFATTLFSVLAAATFVLTIAGTAGNWFERVYGFFGDTDYSKSSITIWGFASTDNLGIKTNLPFKDFVGCDDFTQNWFAVEAFCILSIATACIAFAVSIYNVVVVGAKPTKKANGTFTRLRLPALKTALFFGIATSFFMLISWAIAAKIYYAQWCNNFIYLEGSFYVPRFGFAVFVVGWVAITFGTLVMAYAVLFGTKGSVFSQFPGAGVVFLIGIFIAFIFCVVGTPINWFVFNQSTSKIEVTPWQSTIMKGVTTTELSVADIQCEAQRGRFRAVQAFTILSCLTVFVAFVLGAARLYKNSLRVPSAVFALVASLTQLIAWGIGGSLYHQNFCGQASLFSQGYVLSAGMGLYVAAWCVTLVISVIQLAL